jgi:hypothetical protein
MPKIVLGERLINELGLAPVDRGLSDSVFALSTLALLASPDVSGPPYRDLLDLADLFVSPISTAMDPRCRPCCHSCGSFGRPTPRQGRIGRPPGLGYASETLWPPSSVPVRSSVLLLRREFGLASPPSPDRPRLTDRLLGPVLLLWLLCRPGRVRADRHSRSESRGQSRRVEMHVRALIIAYIHSASLSLPRRSTLTRATWRHTSLGGRLTGTFPFPYLF